MSSDNRTRIDDLYNYFVPWNPQWGQRPTLAYRPAPHPPLTFEAHSGAITGNYGGESLPIDHERSSSLDLYH